MIHNIQKNSIKKRYISFIKTKIEKVGVYSLLLSNQ